MASINKVILIGNLGRDPEVRYSPNGNAMCNVTIATSRNWKDKTSGDKVEETEWHRVVFYDRLAEIAGEYLKKGRSVYVEGRLKTRKWQDKEGKDNYTTEIIAEQHADARRPRRRRRRRRRRRCAATAAAVVAVAARPRRDGARAPARARRRKPAAPKSATGFDDMDDDIPF